MDQPPPAPVVLRRAVLAVSVLADLDLDLVDDGLVLPGRVPVAVSWEECCAALCGHDPESDRGHDRLRRHLQARRWAADLPPELLLARLRPVGLPVGHALHPGAAWVRQRVLGGALDLGLGVVGLDPAQPYVVTVLPAAALPADVDAGAVWTQVVDLLERLGALAAQLLHAHDRGRLHPVGDADVVTLLGARSLRTYLAGRDGGMATAAAPMRTRGWTRLSLVDPAFVPAAAAATAPTERGFARPLLITCDEVGVGGDSGHPERIALRQPAADERRLR